MPTTLHSVQSDLGDATIHLNEQGSLERTMRCIELDKIDSEFGEEKERIKVGIKQHQMRATFDS
jgi:hypothetical protein